MTNPEHRATCAFLMALGAEIPLEERWKICTHMQRLAEALEQSGHEEAATLTRGMAEALDTLSAPDDLRTHPVSEGISGCAMRSSECLSEVGRAREDSK